jgi:hypothetical protein
MEKRSQRSGSGWTEEGAFASEVTSIRRRVARWVKDGGHERDRQVIMASPCPIARATRSGWRVLPDVAGTSSGRSRPVQFQERGARCPIAGRLQSCARWQCEESLWAVASLAHHNRGLAKKVGTVSRHKNSRPSRCGTAKADCILGTGEEAIKGVSGTGGNRVPCPVPNGKAARGKTMSPRQDNGATVGPTVNDTPL